MFKVLVIDDDKITHSFIKRALADEYQLVPVFSGEEGLEKAPELKPDIILLDVEMPGKNGYEVCELLKASEVTRNTPVIFLSSHSGLRDRMHGFEAGADDYIVKPFQPEDLKAKLQVVARYRKTEEQLAHQIKEAQATAHTAIAGSSDLGRAMHFIERSHWVNTFEGLAQEFFKISNYLGLVCTLVMDSDNGEVFFSSKLETVPPLESELISTLRQENRFFDFGCRTQINYQKISLLVKNMPLNDMERYGRIKDLFPAMLSAANSKINQIMTMKVIKSHSDELSRSFMLVTKALNNIKKSVEDSQKTGMEILRTMFRELDQELPRMGLEDDQEQYLLNRVDAAITDAHSATEITKQITDYFTIILSDLERQVSQQQELHDTLNEFLAEEKSEENDEGYSMDIELF